MRKIEIVDDLWLRFPERCKAFDVGLEVGAASVLMAQDTPFIQRALSSEALEQIRPIAEQFRYSITAVPMQDGMMELRLTRRATRPMLRIV